MCPTTFTLNDKKTLQKLRKIPQKLPNCPAMLNIREILGQKIAEPMQSPLTPICPGATLHRELDAQKKRKNLSKLYFVSLMKNIFVPPVECIYVFDVNYSARRGGSFTWN